MAMWAGRFKKEIDSQVNDFNSSISFDAVMYRDDIAGSIAHATMLGEQGIISKEDQQVICKGLAGILDDLDSGKLEFDPNAEDIHMFIEAELTARIGDAGKRLHTARSRNDQVALDVRMYLRGQLDEIMGATGVNWLRPFAPSPRSTPKQCCRGTPTFSGLSPSPLPIT